MSPNQPSDLGQAVNDVVEKTQLLVREEIELAKAEVSEKVAKLVKGAVVGIVGGVFALTGLFLLLHGASWGAWDITQDGGDNLWLGFVIVAVLLFLLGGIAGLIAAKLIKKGSPPKPEMALEEAQRIKETYSTPAASYTSHEVHR